MDVTRQRNLAIAFVKEAIRADQQGNLRIAYELYQKALDTLTKIYYVENDPMARVTIIKRATDYTTRQQKIRRALGDPDPPMSPRSTAYQHLNVNPETDPITRRQELLPRSKSTPPTPGHSRSPSSNSIPTANDLVEALNSRIGRPRNDTYPLTNRSIHPHFEGSQPLNPFANANPYLPFNFPGGIDRTDQNSSPSYSNPDDKKLREALSRHRHRNAKCHVVRRIGLMHAKEALREAVVLPSKLPHLFVGKRKPWRGILLYGPPGTGKSFLAKAVATEIGGTFFSLSSSDLVSKWVGESAKLVKQLFIMAREKKPSVIFIDEIDSLAGKRGSGDKYLRGMKTELLVQMQGVGNDVDGILVLAATNLPWEIDSAVLRRFDKRIFVPLPDALARKEMFENGLKGNRNEISEKQLGAIASRTNGFSGSDIENICRDAIMKPVRRLVASHYFKPITVEVETKWVPSGPDDAKARKATWSDFNPDDLVEPPIEARDLVEAIRNTRPTVTTQDMMNFKAFQSTGMLEHSTDDD